MQGSTLSNFSTSLRILFLSVMLVSCGGGNSNTIPKTQDPDIIKPKVTSITPTPGTNTFANNDVIKIEFDEALNQVVKADTVLITPFEDTGIISNNAVSISDVKFSVENKFLIVEILTTLSAATKYQVIVKKVIDKAGNEMAGECKWEFATKGYKSLSFVNSSSIGACGNSSESSDTTSPTIKSVTPTNSLLSLTTPIKINFDEAIDTSTLKSSIQLSEKNTQTKVNPLPYIISYDASIFEATLTPKINSGLKYNFQYSLNIKSKEAGIKDRSGNPLIDDFIFNYQTNIAPDTSQPKIIEIIPVDKSTVKSDSIITITFSKSMDSATFVNNFELFEVDKTNSALKTALSFKLNFDPANSTSVTFSPTVSTTALLLPNKKYELIVRLNVADTLGKTLTNDSITNFETASVPNQWTWIDGSDQYDIVGSYITPVSIGARNKASSWIDANGDLWVFGGAGALTNRLVYLNDLWKYDGVQWSLIKGDSTTNSSGVYGSSQGVSSTLIYPGSRINAATWTDTTGNLWLFGGSGYDYTGTFGQLNDLWKFDPIKNTWTWVNGENTVNSVGLYKATVNAVAMPPARNNPATWVDNVGNFWLFGGGDYGASSVFDDIWKYSIVDNIWVWIGGSKLQNQESVYTGANMHPGGRSGSIYWKDNKGNFWVLGGIGKASNSTRSLPKAISDMWKFNPYKTTWIFVGGSKTSESNPVYGQQFVADPKNMPGAISNAAWWLDTQNNLWIYGGLGFGQYNTFNAITLGTFWKYDGTNWTWMYGASDHFVYPVYGTKGQSTDKTNPGTRRDSISWVDPNGNFLLFGGFEKGGTSGFGNDLWRFTP